MPVRGRLWGSPAQRADFGGLGRMTVTKEKEPKAPQLAARLLSGEVGGTGLEPVTPSLSTRSSVRVSSLMFAQSASLSGFRPRANT